MGAPSRDLRPRAALALVLVATAFWVHQKKAPRPPVGLAHELAALRELAARGKVVESLQAGEALLASGVKDPFLVTFLVDRYLDRGDPARAEAIARESTVDHPEFLGVRIRLAMAQDAQGRTPEALATLDAVLATAPRNHWAGLSKGRLLAKAGRGPEARALLAALVEAHPSFVEAHWRLGQLAAELGDPAAAEPSLRRAVALAPGDPAALAALGRFLAATGRGAEAAALTARIEQLARSRGALPLTTSPGP